MGPRAQSTVVSQDVELRHRRAGRERGGVEGWAQGSLASVGDRDPTHRVTGVDVGPTCIGAAAESAERLAHVQGGAAVAIEVEVDGIGVEAGRGRHTPQGGLGGDQVQAALVGDRLGGLRDARGGGQRPRLPLQVFAAVDPPAEPVSALGELAIDQRRIAGRRQGRVAPSARQGRDRGRQTSALVDIEELEITAPRVQGVGLRQPVLGVVQGRPNIWGAALGDGLRRAALSGGGGPVETRTRVGVLSVGTGEREETEHRDRDRGEGDPRDAAEEAGSHVSCGRA